MSKLYWCDGRLAKRPFQLAAFDVGIYSVEELCYLIRKRTVLVDRSLMDKALLVFLEQELGANVLTHRKLLLERASLAEYCRAFLEMSVFPVSEREWERIRETLRENETISPFQREMRRGDVLYEERRYFKAFHVYAALTMQTESDRQLAYLYGQMAKASFFLFHYDVSAEFFMRSFRCHEDEDTLLGYLLSKRMMLTKEQYAAFAAENQEYYEMTLRAERLYENACEKARAQTDACLSLPPKERLINEFREMME